MSGETLDVERLAEALRHLDLDWFRLTAEALRQGRSLDFHEWARLVAAEYDRLADTAE